jgi:hypothetical protein
MVKEAARSAAPSVRVGFSFSQTEKNDQIRQPPGAGLQAGALKPPEPVAMPLGRMAPADMIFFTVGDWHPGHLGGGSAGLRTSSSNWQQQFSQRNS